MIDVNDDDRAKYDKLIPKWAKKVTLQFVPQLSTLQTVKANLILPDDKDRLYEVLKYQQSYKANKGGPGCIVLTERTYEVPGAFAYRQLLIDMSMFLFVEIFYYESS